VLDPDDEDEELPLAAFAIAAPPPAITPTAATVASPMPNRLMIHHLLSHLVGLRRVNRPLLRGI
jgi:hypothetical protein